MKFGSAAVLFPILLVASGCSTSAGDSDNGLRVMKDMKPEGAVSMPSDEMSTKSGVPIYPGADVPNGQSSVTSGPTESRLELVMTTKDSVDKVVSFYKGKMPVFNGGMNNGAAEYRGLTPNKSSLHLIVSAKGGKTTIRAAAVVENSPKKP